MSAGISGAARLLALAGAVGLACAGCGAFGAFGTREDPFPVQATAKGVTPQFDLAVEDDRLVVEYVLENRGEEPVVVIDQLPRIIGMGELEAEDIDPALAYVSAPGGGIVRVSRQVWGLGDESGDASVQPVVGGTRIAPGEGHRGRMEVPLPAEARGPEYSSPDYSDRGLRRADSIQVCLGIVDDLDGDAELVPVPAGVDGQVLLCSGTEALPAGMTLD